MIEEYTTEELLAVPTGSVFVYDIECYPNYFAIGFRNIVTNKHVFFEMSPDVEFDADKLRWMIWRFCLVGFNSLSYDLPMMTLSLWGLSARELKKASDKIIFQEMRPRELEKEYGIQLPQLNHVDLIEVAPLSASLKLYGGRLHCKVMQDLPYPHDTELTKSQAENVKTYLTHDLDKTQLILVELFPHIELRQDLGKIYGRDFRSLSDAQVAEAIIGNEIHKATGYYPKRVTDAVEACKYAPPACLKFATRPLQSALATIAGATFTIDGAGNPAMPDALKRLSLTIGRTTYKLGMGGLHSQESEVEYKATEDTFLIDRDVASYYPRIVLNQKLYPKHLGEIFLTKYEEIVNRRLTAKKAGNKKVSEGLKIAINGIFGKFGNRYSVVYAPDLMLQVTISGQLFLLMLIEAIELAGIPVVSGNTDGIVIMCPKDRYNDLLAIVKAWEVATGFETEETRYKRLNARDVNNYIAVKEDGTCKTKGVYSEKGSAQNSVLSKNPETLICSDALQSLLSRDVPIANTIRNCSDVRRFISVRNVKGGAEKDGVYLGKAVRWYYAKAQIGAINYVTSGNKVPKTDNAKPLMVLPDCLPSDIDYQWYIDTTNEMLFDIGYFKRAATASLF